MRNCWIWSVCLVLGGALSANAAIITGDVTMNQGAMTSLSFIWNQDSSGSYDVVDVYIKSMTPGASINSMTGQFDAVGGKFLTFKHSSSAQRSLALRTEAVEVGGTPLDPRPAAPNYSFVNFSSTSAVVPTVVSYVAASTWGTGTGIRGVWNGTLSDVPSGVFYPLENLSPAAVDSDLDGLTENLFARLFVEKSTTKITFGDPLTTTGEQKFGYDVGGQGRTEITQFTITPTVVPEPGTMALLLTGGLALAGFGWRRRK